MIPRPESGKENPVPVDVINSFIGNTEMKCVLQLLVKPEELLYAPQLNERFALSQEPPGKVKYKSLNNLAQAVTVSHRVAKTLEASEQIVYSQWWVRKPADAELGDSIAGHNLAIASDYSLSLEKLWGKTSTTSPDGIRSPQIRLQIFELLADLTSDQHITLTQLSAKSGLSAAMIFSHIRRLNKSGFVQYEADTLSSQLASFEIIGDPDPAKSKYTRRGERVRQHFRFRGSPTLRVELGQILMDIQKEGRSSFGFKDLDERLRAPGPKIGTLQDDLGVMLRDGVIQRQHKSTAAHDEFSKIYLDDMQKEIIDKVVRAHRGLKAGDRSIISEGIQLGNLILADRQLVRELLERGYKNSSVVASRDFQERSAELQSLLNGKELSTSEIQLIYEDAKLSIEGIGTAMRRMREAGQVISRRVKNQMFWRLPDDFSGSS